MEERFEKILQELRTEIEILNTKETKSLLKELKSNKKIIEKVMPQLYFKICETIEDLESKNKLLKSKHFIWDITTFDKIKEFEYKCDFKTINISNYDNFLPLKTISKIKNYFLFIKKNTKLFLLIKNKGAIFETQNNLSLLIAESPFIKYLTIIDIWDDISTKEDYLIKNSNNILKPNWR